MPAVVVQLGQCGNQVGVKFFSALDHVLTKFTSAPGNSQFEDYYCEIKDRFFCDVDRTGSRSRPRAVMIDMEPKVILQAEIESKRSLHWCYTADQQFTQKHGSGNNWAYGYCVHGPKIEPAILDLVRKQVEACDRIDGFLPVMSLAGGTGSGVGTFVTESLRNEYPKAFILNEAVWPHASGEVITQNYNAVLTLARLYECSDAILVLENDQLHAACQRLLKMKLVSFEDINRLIAWKMCSVFLPAYREGAPATTSSSFIGDYLEQLVCQPDYKLLRLLNIPVMPAESTAYSSFLWSGLLKHLRQMLIACCDMEEGINWQVKVDSQLQFNRSISNALILRGSGIDAVDCSAFSDSQLYAPWVPAASRLTAWRSPVAFLDNDKSAALLSNSAAAHRPLDTIVSRAWNMYTSNAYVHQYTRHGLSSQDFSDSFLSLESVLWNYSHLT